MKKYRIFALLLALIICTSVICVSCNETASSYKLSDIMNSEWRLKREGTVSKQFERAYYTDQLNTAENGFSFWWDYETIETTPNFTHYTHKLVYSASSPNPILTIKDIDSINNSDTSQDVKQWNYFDVISSEYFAVLTETVVYKDGYGTATYVLNIYDSNGNIIGTIDEETIRALNGFCVPEYYSNYVANNSEVELYRYRADKNVREEMKVDFELWVGEGGIYCFDGDNRISLVNNYKNEYKPLIEYMKRFGNNYLETVNGIYSVYDKELNKTLDYPIPDGESKAFVLANGDLLVQYLKPIGEGEKDFDAVSYSDEKLDLITLIVHPDGVSEISDIDYVIDDIEPSFVGDDGQRAYADSVENLALVYPINSKNKVDYSEKELVLIDNNGTINGKVKIKENIVDFPRQYTDEYYYLELEDKTYAIYDKNDRRVSVIDSQIMNSEIICDEYFFVDEKIIYNSVGKKIFDFSDENNLKIFRCGNTIITKYRDDSFNYEIFVDGEFKFIGSSDDPDFGFRSSPGSCIQYLDLLAYSKEIGYYIVRMKSDNGYTENYYNTKGELFASTNDSLQCFMSNKDAVVMREGSKYYIFKIK